MHSHNSQSMGDTGEEEAEEPNDPSLYWPEKIVLDAPNNALMLIWFNTSTPRHNTLSFDKIDKFIVVPSEQMRPAELQLLLKDERKFRWLLAKMYATLPNHCERLLERSSPTQCQQRSA